MDEVKSAVEKSAFEAIEKVVPKINVEIEALIIYGLGPREIEEIFKHNGAEGDLLDFVYHSACYIKRGGNNAEA